ncbi:MAG: branched-chain amino acid transport system ATP-binding protein [Actinomycetota bacterium]|jgi:branched-chain amino acid transport system ATP-binding protein|nr:branched-chain amino acid transport system ATP-binding protein [Actinomycetota bacterium]
MSVLETRGCSIRFGGVQAARDVSIRIGEWEIVGIIGPNGAGKTTTFNMITGFYTPNEGQVFFKGVDITPLPVHERTALGMGRTFQNVGLVKGSTVRENLKTAQHLRAGYGVVAGMVGLPQTFRTETELAERSDLLLDILGLGDLADTRVAGLPYGVLKRVEVATVLATDPDVLLLDEPSSGMGPEEAHRLGDTLLDLRREFGISIAMIEHHVPLVVRVCDYVYCLNFGELLAEGKPEEVRNHPEVVRAYLGEDPEDVVA